MLGSPVSVDSIGEGVSGRKAPGVPAVPQRSPGMRPLARALLLAFAAAAALPGAAWAAGLGRLSVLSALGQPLRAEVEISSLSKEEAATISARLGSQEAFRQAGLEPSGAVSGLRFAIERRADGRAVVTIASSQPVNEPFVDLVVELSWASGRFVRGYTFLLDPPEMRSSAREVFEGGPVAAAPASAAARPSDSAAAVPRGPARADAARAGTKIPVSPGDTLRSIAGRVRPDNLTLEQVMVGLYRANPAAFLGGMSEMRADATLTVPEAAAMAEASAAEARALVRGDGRAAAAQRTRIADAAPSVPAAPAGQSAEGAVGKRTPDRAPPSRDQLRLSGPESGSQAPSMGRAAAPKADAAGGGDARLAEVQGKLAELEKSIGEMQRMLEVKNRQLAELQKQIEEARSAGRAVTGTVGTRPPGPPAGGPAVPVAPPAAGAATGGAPAMPAAAPASPVAGSAASEPAQPAPAAAPPAAIPAPTADAPPSAPQPPAPKPAQPPAPAPAPAPPSFLDDLLAEPFTLPAFGAVLLLVAGYGWYAVRRRRKVARFDDSLVSPEGLAANSLFGATGGQSVDTAGTGFAGPAASAGADIHAAEVDPIAEAEVYIAYGREAQAEEILREALARQPDRQALRSKLLEIYANRRDVDAFNQAATEMYAATAGRNEEWSKVVAMGAALDPGNALYIAPAGQAPVEPDVHARLDAALSQPPVESRPTALPVEEPLPTEPMLEFGPVVSTRAGGVEVRERSEPSAAPREPVQAPPATEQPPADVVAARPEQVPAPAPAPVAEKPALEFAPLDFDLGLTKTDAPAPAPPAAPARPVQAPAAPAAGEPAPSAADALAFSIDFEPVAAAAGAEPAAPATAVPPAPPAAAERGPAPVAVPGSEPAPPAASGTVSDLEKAIGGRFDLPSLDLTGLPELPKAAAAAEGGGAEPDFSAVTLDLEPAAVIESPQDAKGQDLDTRLDLAAAFVEIGDKDGARELIEQVLKEGDDGQQKRARGMLEKLG